MYVYCVRQGQANVCKIGYSKEPFARLKSLQTANPEILTLCWTVLEDELGLIEADLHTLLKNQGRHIRGEWFRGTPAELLQLCTEIYFESQAETVELSETLQNVLPLSTNVPENAVEGACLPKLEITPRHTIYG